MAQELNVTKTSRIHISTNDLMNDIKDFFYSMKGEVDNYSNNRVKVVFNIGFDNIKDGNMPGDFSLVEVLIEDKPVFECLLSNVFLNEDFIDGFVVYENRLNGNYVSYPALVEPEAWDLPNYFISFPQETLDMILKAKEYHDYGGNNDTILTIGDPDMRGKSNNISGNSVRFKNENLIGNTKQAKVGRNEPCYCGSGKKFKKCHG